MKTSTKVKRLLKLADYLDGIERKKFVFHERFNNGKASKLCLLGTAGTMISFRRSGFKTIAKEDQSYRIEIDDAPLIRGELAPVAEFFGITEYDANELFSPYNWSEPGTGPVWYPSVNPTPKQVAKGLRNFVASKMKDVK